MEDCLKRIGEIAKATGVSVDTIRHYERIGVLPIARRSSGGYRLFPPEAIARVTLVRNALQFGFSLKQLAGFLKARERGGSPCRQVRATAEQILARLDQRIVELEASRASMRRTLKDWDERLARAGDGVPARLLDALPSRRSTVRG